MVLDFTATKVVDNQSVNAASELALSNCTATDCSTVIACSYSGTLTFNASATGNAVVKVYFSYDNTNYASTHSDEYTVTCSAGNAVSFAFGTLPLAEKMKVAVENEDASYSITAITIYANTQADA